MRTLALLSLTAAILSAAPKNAAVERLENAADLLTDMMRSSDKGVPQDLLNKSRCVILVPGAKKAGFILGVKYGRGFAFCRNSAGTGWTAPAAIRVEGSAGGGMVTVVINGHKAMLSITIDPEAVSKDDVEMLQDLVLAAINDAHRKADEQLSQQMSGLMGGMGMPGLR